MHLRAFNELPQVSSFFVPQLKKLPTSSGVKFENEKFEECQKELLEVLSLTELILAKEVVIAIAKKFS